GSPPSWRASRSSSPSHAARPTSGSCGAASACASGAVRRAATTSGWATTPRCAWSRAAWRGGRRRASRATTGGCPPTGPSRFPPTDRSGEHAGDLVALKSAELARLPPIRTVLRFGRKLEERALPVQLEAQLTEIGTLALWCRSRTTDHRWRLEFRLRDTVGAEAPPPEAAGALVIHATRISEA